MAYIPPFERGPLSDDPDEVETLLAEAAEFLQASDEQVATDAALLRRDRLARLAFRGFMQFKLTEAGKPNVVDGIRADRDNVFADELLLAMQVELPPHLRRPPREEDK